jgi:Acetyltransferase (GNAT) domain
VYWSVWSVQRASRSTLSAAADPYFPREVTYEGSGGTAWCVGVESRAPSIAAFFCGDDVRAGRSGRIRRQRVPARTTQIAAAGGLPILRLPEPEGWPADVLRRAIVVPLMIDLHAHLPADPDTLATQLLTSRTRGDFRRIRHANFSYRITTDPAAIREFYARHHAPLLAQRYPEDGLTAPVESMLDKLSQGGELVCADIDGTWVAGLFNVAKETSYDLGAVGIRDADDSVRQKSVVAALLVRSFERAVELGRDRVWLGRSLPFLGKSSVYFKEKWGAVITRDAAIPDLHMFLDIRHAAVRRMLSATPIVHTEDDALVVSTWLEPGAQPVRDTARDARRFPGISRWYVLAEPQTLAGAAEQLSASERIVPVPVTLRDDDRSLWLGETLPGPAASPRDSLGERTPIPL